LPEIVQSVSVVEEPREQYTPPPQLATFPEIVQFFRVGEEPFVTKRPPPYGGSSQYG
jgi:hypothetical protein